jgi:hypothetical protein
LIDAAALALDLSPAFVHVEALGEYLGRAYINAAIDFSREEIMRSGKSLTLDRYFLKRVLKCQ